MFGMFDSATIKLTAWYLAILMSISVLFSAGLYIVASSEVQARLEGLQRTIKHNGTAYVLPPDRDLLNYRKAQAQKADANLILSLFYVNILVLVAGGAGSHWLARRTLQPLKDAHEAESRFVSDASHELRTPLTVMQAELEVALRQGELSQAEVKELLESSLEEVTKLSKLAEMLLQLSKLDGTSLEFRRTNFSRVIRDVTKRYDKAGTRFKLALPKRSLYLQGDKTSLEELVTILADNALKYSPPDSAIPITAVRDRQAIVLTISNSGAGIPPDALPHIFERFYRVSHSRSSQNASGFGLGLSLAKRITALHGGTIEAKSITNKSTIFTITLPVNFTPPKSSS